MANISNKFDIKNSIEDEAATIKSLPAFFDNSDEISHVKCFGYSIAAHAVFIIFACLLQVIVFSHLPKPALPVRDVEFKLVDNPEQMPINKNTKIRADRNSRAGGKHDPKKKVSEPKPSPKPEKSPAKPAAKQPLAQKLKPQPKQTKNVQAPQKQQPVKQQPVKPQPVKPAPAASNVVKPSLRPALKPQGSPTPSAPKVAPAPNSPFKVAAPSVKAPVGNVARPQGVAGGTSGPASGGHVGAPAPKFSSSGSSSGASGSSANRGVGSPSYGTRGGYGTPGNPSPGNPNGNPGIDAIKQPQWGPYMKDLEQRIKRNWVPPKGDTSKRIVITFKIARDGRLLEAKLTRSSGVPMADEAAMHAIKATAPFRPLPPEFRGTSVPIEFTFDYNVLNMNMKY